MLLGIVTLLVLVMFGVSLFFLRRLISQNFRKDRALSRVRDDQIIRMLKNFDNIAVSLSNTSEFLSSSQTSLNRKINALTKFIDEQTSCMAFQQNQFHELVKADMLAARREELLRTKELKVALERLMGVAMTSRQPPASNDVLALENVTKRIEELEVILQTGDILDGIMN